MVFTNAKTLILVFIFISAQIGLFYTAFYVSLVAMFGVVLWVFFQTLDPRTPTRQLEHSLIGTNPGILIQLKIYTYLNETLKLFICFLKAWDLGLCPMKHIVL